MYDKKESDYYDESPEALRRWLKNSEERANYLNDALTALRRREKALLICGILIIIALFIALLCVPGRDTYNSQERISELKSQKTVVENENAELEQTLQELRSDFNWLSESVKLVVADSGDLYKTYHNYECDKWRGHSVWIYNKEQVVDNYQYTKCPDCN